MGARPSEMTFEVAAAHMQVPAILLMPAQSDSLLMLAHGAGADMRHRFMEAIAHHLADVNIGTFRYQFPYSERGRRYPDPPDILKATVRSAIQAATEAASGTPLLAGGKSLGGRMTSMAEAEEHLPGVRGLVFLGFPLHAPGKEGSSRAEHLEEVQVPLLFLQGSRDKLANLDLLRPVIKGLGSRATLHVISEGDHSFRVPKGSGRSEDEIMSEMATAICDWAEQLKLQASSCQLQADRTPHRMGL